jgi:hypothetical protein
MAKRKSAQEMLATRNPLQRVSIAPVDIYAQPPVAQSEPVSHEQPTATDKKPPGKTAKNTSQTSQSPSKTPSAKPGQGQAEDPVGHYSTYLRKSQVKQIKFRAVEREVKDQHIVQEAIDEYFRRHPE